MFQITCRADGETTLYFTEQARWSPDPSKAKVYEEKGPDWGLPFAPDDRDDTISKFTVAYEPLPAKS